MPSDEFHRRLDRAGVVAVLTIDDVEHAVPVARALRDGGVSVIELTLRTATAVDCIRRIRAEMPDMFVGAGTVITSAQIDEVVDAGARFAVAPGCNPGTIAAARVRGLPFAPGVMTPTEIEIALAHECRILKFFPAESSGGMSHLATMAAPFAHLGLRFVPLGGIGMEELPLYLASPLVLAVGGSWLAKPDVIRRCEWEVVRENAAAAMRIVNATRRPTAS